MSGYETLASTKLLATHCAACGKPLREAGSVTVSLGPVCREKYGYDDVQVSSEARAEANRLIYLIADKRQGPPVLDAASRLRALGFTRLASIILARLIPIRLERVTSANAEAALARVPAELREQARAKWGGDRLRLFSPYDPDATARLCKVPGRWFNGEEKANEFPYTSRNALWLAIRELFVGKKMLGPDGAVMEIPAAPKRLVESGFGDVEF